MKIGLNLLYLIPGVVGGTQTYAVSLIKALAAVDSENEYYIFLNQEAAQLNLVEAPNFHRVVCPLRALRRPVRSAWEQFILPWQLRYYQIDAVHSLGYVGPLFAPCPSVVTIHDVNYRFLKQEMTTSKAYILRYFVEHSARRSTHVIVDSCSSKFQLVKFGRIQAGQITVIYLAPRATSVTIPHVGLDNLAARYQVKAPYVVAVGGLSAHKNISRLIRAFAQGASGFPHRLVLVGHLPPGTDLQAEIAGMGLADRVITTGYVPDEHILPFLGHADLFVFPSWYEGFGLPVLEAQQAGVPVACSTAGALPEVAGDGAIFFDPYSVEEIAKTINKCLDNAELRQALVQKGYANLTRFSWEKTARETLDVYYQISTMRTNRSSASRKRLLGAS